MTWFDFGNAAGLDAQGGLPLLGGPGPAVHLELGAAEHAAGLGFVAAVRAQAHNALPAQQEDAAHPIAEHRYLQPPPACSMF